MVVVRARERFGVGGDCEGEGVGVTGEGDRAKSDRDVLQQQHAGVPLGG